MKPKEFVKKHIEFARETERKTGISAVYVLAQAALETGWGQHAPGNMYFGVKAKHGTPVNRKQLIRTREVMNHPHAEFPVVLSITKRADGKYDYVVKDWFMKYDTPEESFTAHAELLLNVPRYRKALAVKHNPYAYADAIAAAGYATDPQYATTLKKIIRMIEQYV